MKPSELPGTRSLYRLTNRALIKIRELWQYAGEDELPPDSFLQAQVEALRILHIEVPLSAKRQFQLFFSEHFPGLANIIDCLAADQVWALLSMRVQFVESDRPHAQSAALRCGGLGRPYSGSEVIHRAGDESLFPAFERERPRIVNNFAASAPSGYEFSSISEKMNSTRLSNLPDVLGSGNEYSDDDGLSLETITSGYKEFASGSGRANDHYLLSNMNESFSEQPLSPKVAAFVGIDWAVEKHDVVLRSVGD